jgi:hypothetical protein
VIRPEIHAILSEIGISKRDESSLTGNLSAAGLSLDNLLDQLSSISSTSQSDAIKLRAIETALKMHGVLKEQAAPPPSISITITDPYGQTSSVNPILIPRPQKELVQ